jgi:Zn-dependent peptidase ImmA (M78 family)
MERDLLPPEIEEQFLDFVDKFHAQHGYERNFRVLAQKLNITVTNGQKDEYFTTADEKPHIVIDISNPRNRQRFSGLHELSHYLFENAKDGELRAFLRSFPKMDSELSRQLEEKLCNQAAAQMLVPTPIFAEVKSKHGYSPQSVFELAKKTEASLQVSMKRLIFAYSIDVHTVIVDRNCKVIDSLAHGCKREKYNIGNDFILPSTHPLSIMIKNKSNQIIEDPELFEANVPFRHRSTKWKSNVIASFNLYSNKTIAFFLDKYPDNNPNQLSLFQNFANEQFD